ncbi:MAG TPA: efflux RND transporter periplasmic adaptor subunit [Noviherbaspirillum sp.]|uniref:efflux RND transporter periplasmic adaptor subunit n=1 Tax=Noviherbaspirillum sp. TaxID=1926288 RepID=UPI002B460660|nr:efflux RND transporter periplasmic adaptor subunit [Noviherbaspirillum sp.]HJV85254.1 efflux RND transporter periplasmic adaptor subunit [Noviherbaspirillum sp.]
MLRKILYGIVIATALAPAAWAGAQDGLPTATVQSAGTAEAAPYDGVVEAVRQTVMASQVPGAIIALPVKAGDVVKEGQVLVRIDARAAAQNSAASEAQVQAARAALELATKDFQRQQQLYKKEYISQAAFERAESQYRATSAQLRAQIAQASAASIQSGFYTVKAPYAGVIADVPVSLGDMAMPGRPLLTIYAPTALRVTASVPQTALARVAAGQPVKVELPGLPADRQWMTIPQLQVLPTIDAGTHSAQVRVDLPADVKGVTPGMFARVWLPSQGAGSGRLYVPSSAVVRRAEMTGLYVIDAKGQAILRQVRTGRVEGERIEILSGVAAGERVVLDPQAAARSR